MVVLTKQMWVQSLIILKVKITTTKSIPRILWVLTKIKSNSRARKVHVLCVGNPGIMLGSVSTEKDQKWASMNAIGKEIIATLSNVCVVQEEVQGWWYDTSATVHISYDKYIFKTFEDAKGDQEVQMSNEGGSKVLGKGHY